jgi:hypothetical protein
MSLDDLQAQLRGALDQQFAALKQQYEAAIGEARQQAVAEAQRDAEGRLVQIRAEMESRLAESIEAARVETERTTREAATLERQASEKKLRKDLDRDFQVQLEHVINSVKRSAELERENERRKAQVELDNERELAIASLTTERERTSVLLAGAHEHARAEVAAERERLSAEVAAERERARTEIAELTARAQSELANERERTRAEAMAAAFEKSRVDIEAMTAEAEAAKAQIEASRAGLEAELGRATAEFQAQRNLWAQGEAERERLRLEQDAEHERRRVERDAEQERLRAELERIRGEHEPLRAEHETARAELERLGGEHQQLRAALDSARADQERVRAEHQSARAELERISGEHQQLRVTHESARADHESARAEQERALAELGRVRVELEAERERLRAAIEAERRRADAIPPAPPPTISTALADGVRDLDDSRTLTEALDALVTHAAVLGRAALFVIDGDRLKSWKAVGIADVDVRPVESSIRGSDLLARAIQDGQAIRTSDDLPAPPFAGASAQRAGLGVPVMIGGRAVAALYVDHGDDAPPADVAADFVLIESLARHASAVIALRTAMRTLDVLRGVPLDARPDDESSDEPGARRFARLLVSEIKLYNDAAVRAGRQQRDLLQRLGPEIDRARRLYEERVPASLGSRQAYFHQELVQTLADGDPALLGTT